MTKLRKIFWRRSTESKSPANATKRSPWLNRGEKIDVAIWTIFGAANAACIFAYDWTWVIIGNAFLVGVAFNAITYTLVHAKINRMRTETLELASENNDRLLALVDRLMETNSRLREIVEDGLSVDSDPPQPQVH